MASLCLKWVQYLSYIVYIKRVDGLVLSVLWLSAGMALDKLIMNNFPSLNGKIEIHDSQCNFRCQAINNFKIFCRINTSSQYSEMTLASWRLQPWATRLFVQQIIQTNSNGNAGIAIDIMTVTQHIVAQYGDINLSTLTRVMACCLTELYYYLNQFWLIISMVQWGDTSAIIY